MTFESSFVTSYPASECDPVAQRIYIRSAGAHLGHTDVHTNQTLDKYLNYDGRQAQIWVNGSISLSFASYVF